MDGGLPMLNCLLQHTLRSLCTTNSNSDSSISSKWVYSIFWRILPRNYPPPKWDNGGSLLDRAKGNKRNWILVWEDGYCDFYECEREGSGYVKGRFGADIFFKMSHEVYNFGEGLVGKVASDNSHKWVYRDSTNENDPTFIPSWNVSIDPQPRAWETHFNSGIQTIAIISVREGIVQLGSFEKVAEDLNLVINIQRKFSYLQSIPGIYAVQRPYLPPPPLQFQYPQSFFNNNKPNSNNTPYQIDDKHQLIGTKRFYSFDRPDDFPTKSVNFGYNSPNSGIPSGASSSAAAAALWSMSIPPLLPCTPCNPAIPKISSSSAPLVYHGVEAINSISMLNKQNINSKTTTTRSRSPSIKINQGSSLNEINVGNIKVETSCPQETDQEEKTWSSSHHLGLECRAVELGFGPPQGGGRGGGGETALNYI